MLATSSQVLAGSSSSSNENVTCSVTQGVSGNNFMAVQGAKFPVLSNEIVNVAKKSKYRIVFSLESARATSSSFAFYRT